MTATNHRPTTRETPHANDELLTLPEVADLVRVPVATLRYWRHLGCGPRSFRVGRHVRYWRRPHPLAHRADRPSTASLSRPGPCRNPGAS